MSRSLATLETGRHRSPPSRGCPRSYPGAWRRFHSRSGRWSVRAVYLWRPFEIDGVSRLPDTSFGFSASASMAARDLNQGLEGNPEEGLDHARIKVAPTAR